MEVLPLFLCSNSTIDLSINSWALRNDKSFEYLGEGCTHDIEYNLTVIMRVPGRVSQKGLCILNIGFEGLSRPEIQSSLTKHHTSLIE
jgi:hypothetical protein